MFSPNFHNSQRLLFLSIQMDSKRHEGATFEAFSFFFQHKSLPNSRATLSQKILWNQTI